MYEVIIERPRGGAGWARPWPRRTPWRLLAQDDDGTEDGGPTKVCMGPRIGSKWLNENLAPLRRFLLSRVGRPWDDVHSEIAAHIAPRSAVQTHVLSHLEQYVERNVVMINGWPHHPIAWGKDRKNYRPLASWKYSFYVCPETGLLRLAWKRRVRASELK
jgi:hypothetical protein